MAAYPFWGDVAAHTGRLLRLQRTVAAMQVHRRLKEEYGDRETVARRVRYVLRSSVDWGVLNDGSTKGIYTQGAVCEIVDVDLVAWLVEAFLHAQPSGRVSLSAVLSSTSLFPFRLKPVL